MSPTKKIDPLVIAISSRALFDPIRQPQSFYGRGAGELSSVSS